jgi:flagellar hook-associated protein 2
MGSTVDGLVSGLSTTDLISQLMKVEAAPQDSLRSKVSVQEKRTTALQAVNAKLAGLKTASEALTADTAFNAVKTTSSSSSVAASGTAGAAAGLITFDVKKLASSQVSTITVPDSGDFAQGSSIALTIGTGDPKTIDVTTNTPQGVADAINKANVGVKASVVITDTGTRLQLTSSKTGTDNAFTLGGLNGTQSDLTTASNAQVTVGDPDTTGYRITSQSNTFTGLISGVSVTVSKEETGVTVGATSDVNSLADKMQALVDQANGIMSDITAKTAYNADTKTAQPLSGNSMVRSIPDTLQSAVVGGQTGFGSFKQLGVEVNRGGTLKFDRDAFLKAYAADPDKIKNAIFTKAVTEQKDSNGTVTVAGREATGLAANLLRAATTGDKNLTAAATSGASLVKTLNSQIDSWDIRLATKKAALSTQFTNLETALSKLKNQSSWLAGQLSSLSSS